jgi:hypothetical protein
MSELQELLLKKEEMDPQQQLQILQQQVGASHMVMVEKGGCTYAMHRRSNISTHCLTGLTFH